MAGAYLTQDLLRKRKALTKNGRQKLVFDYGFNGETREFSLAELNRMAKRVETVKGQLKHSENGIDVQTLIKTALPSDKKKARDIPTAMVYKFDADHTVYLQVGASGDTPNAPSHYLVRIRLEEWDNHVEANEGNNYLVPAQRATMGRISFDCNCGRHTYWYRYLATIGNFAVAPPKETVFPKIRNPKLKGVCCKHVIKAALAIQNPGVQARVAKQMKSEAKSHGFGKGTEKYLTPKAAQEMEAISKFETKGAFNDFRKAMRAFKRKQTERESQKALNKLKESSGAQMKRLAEEKKAAETVAKREIAERRKLEQTVKSQHLAMLKTLKMGGMLNDAMIGTYAGNANIDKDVLLSIAKEEGLL